MKKLSFISIFAIMVAAFVVLPSCKDDDEKTSQETPEDGVDIEDPDDVITRTYWGIVSQLVNPSTVSSDGGTVLQPSIGYASSSSDASVRYVLTNTLEAAAQRFNALVGSDLVDENTTTETWKDENVGTLTYTKTNDGTSLATVDVDIKNLNLTRIVYLTAEQSGNNGKFSGTAYYRFGDVISRNNEDGNPEYWVCVRPSFGPEDKETSHWISVSPVADKYLTKYTSKTNNESYSYPKQSAGILKGDNYAISPKNYMNLAEMLYAITNPSGWEQNLLYNSKAAVFEDFKRDNLKYHNSTFWKRVQDAWKDKGIDQKLFGRSLASIESSLNKPEEGLHLLYDGSWSWTVSNYLYLYEYVYTNGKGKEVNMHKETKKKTSKDVIKGGANKSAIKIDFATQYTEATPFIKNEEFFGDAAPRYLARYATGAQLASDGKYDVKLPIAGVTEVYRYNDYYNINNLNVDPEIASLAPNSIVDGFFVAGDVVKTSDGSRWICVAGSPSGETFNITNHEAYFISFDNIVLGANSNIISNQTDAVVTAYRLIEFINILRQSREDDDRFVINGALGKPLSKIKELTDVDISKCFTFRDSTWTFMNGGQAYESESTNIMVNFAYGDECNLLRYVHDVTRAGTRRDKRPSGTKADWYHWFYTKYENYDDSKIRKLTKEEEEVFLYTKWNLPWPMSDDVMKISDLFTDLYVATYAQPDKWATLPLSGKTARQPYRTRRDDYKLSDYVFKKGADFKKNMYNEPILVCRLMKVDDNGSSIQTAPDGSPLSILYHSTDINFKILCNTQWIASYTTHIGEEIPEVFLNNEAYQLPALPTKQ